MIMAVVTKLQKQPKAINSLRDRWRTPQWLFNAIQQTFDVTFDVDVACDHTNSLCPRALTITDDALTCGWGERGTYAWLNPPYSKIDVWIHKAIEQQRRGVTTVMLVPQSLDTRWYELAQDYCETVLITGGRVQFDLAHAYDDELDNQKRSSNTGGSMLLIFKTGFVSLSAGQMRTIPLTTLKNLTIA